MESMKEKKKNKGQYRFVPSNGPRESQLFSPMELTVDDGPGR